MTETEAQQLIKSQGAIRNFNHFHPNVEKDTDYINYCQKNWLWYDRSGDIWFDFEDTQEIDNLMNSAPYNSSEILEVRKWLRMFLKKRPDFNLNILREELIFELESMIFEMCGTYFKYNPNTIHWGACDVKGDIPINEKFVEWSQLLEDSELFRKHFRLDIWEEIIRAFPYDLPLQKYSPPQSQPRAENEEESNTAFLPSIPTASANLPPSVNRGAPMHYLFALNDNDKKENVDRKRIETDRFVNFIKTHKYKSIIDSSTENKLNMVIVCFVKIWIDKKYILKTFATPALYRFITEDCKLHCEVTPKAWQGVIRKMASTDYDKELYFSIKDCFEKN